MTLISSTRFFNGALLAGAMALISTEVAVAQPAPGTADSSGRLVQTWDKTFPRSEKVDHQKVTFKNRYGITLAADVYLPKDRGNKKLAALVISGPFGAVKEQASGLYAQTLAERGFVTLAFDPSLPGKPALRQRGTSRKPAWPPRGSVWSRLTRRWIVSPSKRDLAAVLTCDACLRNSLTSLQVNIVNDFTVAKWRKVILFCHLRHNPSVLL